MSDIFLSYANADLPRVLPLIHALEAQGWSVWWDRENIPPGARFRRVIQEALTTARCVVVVWSAASVESDWVETEADHARERDTLIPVRIDNTPLPFVFDRLHTVSLIDWQGDADDPEFRRVVAAIAVFAPLTAEVAEPPVPTPEIPPQGPESTLRQTPESPPQVLETTPQPGPEPVPTPGPRDGVRIPVARTRTRRNIGFVLSVVLLSLAVVTYYLSVSDKTYRNAMGMEFVRIQAGEFRMGSENGDGDERPIHTVRISQPFYLGKYEVTQDQWQAVMEDNPSSFSDDVKLPVENVSWDTVQTFITKLNEREGVKLYRLPTEAEWEYAARADTDTAYSFGDSEEELSKYAWYSKNAESKTHAVGQLQPNAWGLYDMHGNVWEWVQDWYGKYSADIAATAVDPQGPASGTDRVFRGGGWSASARYCQSAIRHDAPPGYRHHNLGFRVLRQAL